MNWEPCWFFLKIEFGIDSLEKATMEASAENKSHKQQEFALASVFELASSSSSSSALSSSSTVAWFSVDDGIPELRFYQESQSFVVVNVDLRVA
ncbi:hypothetical protein CsatB_002760 [Cannabis sativa]